MKQQCMAFCWLALMLISSGWCSSDTTTPRDNSKTAQEERRRRPPHVLFVLVDDLGWGDVGFHQPGSKEIQTPTIDRLAQEEGLILNRHYVHSSCTGTRVSLQSGRLPVHVQTSLKLVEDPSSGMPRNMTGMAEHLQKAAGYRTHYVGKWDVGMATPKHTPHGRGYETSLHYFEHKNDYWTQMCMQSACCPNFGIFRDGSEDEIPDFWEAPRPQSHYNLSLVDLWDTLEPARTLNGTDYEEFLFLERMKKIVRNHPKEHPTEPLFLFYAPHVAHCPLQVPQEYLDKFDEKDDNDDDDDDEDHHLLFSDDETVCRAQTPRILSPNTTKDAPFSCRKQYHAMVNLLDDILKSLVEELQEAGLWNDTLLVFTSDNGGPTKLEESGSTNFDLRGGKYSDWEGGVRAVAFLSGGYLPEDRRGLVLEEPVHITDWYATLAHLAGVTEPLDDDSQGGRYPPIDALNLWPVLSGAESQSPRQEIPLSKRTLIQGDYKLMWDPERLIDQSGWTGPIYPNSTSYSSDIFVGLNCSEGCLFNVAEDRGEHHDLAQEMPIRVQAMKQRLLELQDGFYENDDKGDDSCPTRDLKEDDGDDDDDDDGMPCACWMAINYYGGFLGPYQEIRIERGRE